MVRHGKHVVLMRDMTDSMYSPKSWPYVDHFRGHDLVISHVEQYVCPTITSDQFLGGEPFRWKADKREVPKSSSSLADSNTTVGLTKHWHSMRTIDVHDAMRAAKDPLWFRGAMRVPAQWLANGSVKLGHNGAGKVQVWMNGHEITAAGERDQFGHLYFIIPKEHVILDDYNLIVLKITDPPPGSQSRIDMSLEVAQAKEVGIDNASWQVRVGNDLQFSNIPLPAKFGIGPDAVLVLEE